MATQSVRIGLKPGHSLQDVQNIVKWMLGHGGCLACGRLARLDLGFQEVIQPELEKIGAVSIVEQVAR